MMMAASVIDKLSVVSSRTEEGHKEYHVTWLVECPLGEGVESVMSASGLYEVGAYWDIGSYTNSWAFCQPTMQVRGHDVREGEETKYWEVEQVFSTKNNSRRCQDNPITDPLLEPYKISGGFVSERMPVQYDKDGYKLVTSAGEQIVGPETEFDIDKPTVRFQHNVASLGIETFSLMINCVNQAPLWGLPARCIKLSNVTWERNIYGRCSYYYSRIFDFQIDHSTQDHLGEPIGFDRELPDKGHRALKGFWLNISTDTKSEDWRFIISATVTETTSEIVLGLAESNFIDYVDPCGNACEVWLDGKGRPANAKLLVRDDAGSIVFPAVNGAKYRALADAGEPAYAVVRRYREVNFLTLGVPSTL